MSVASPQNREEFKQYMLTRLGHPVLQVNVADEQMDICINDAFQYFNERNHFNGVENVFLTYEVTTEFEQYFKSFCQTNVQEKSCDITAPGAPDNIGTSAVRRQNAFLTLPDDVVGVVQVLQTRGSGGLGGVIPPGSIFPLLMGGAAGGGMECGGGFGLTTWFVMQGYMALLNFLLRPPKSWNFNQRTHRLSLHGDLDFAKGSYIALECMVKPSPDIYPDLWNDMWLKQYATALVKEQWGLNLTKYNQVQMPGGITMNGQQILGDAQKELEQLRSRFAMDFADPPTAILVG
jgi:hypothetical protein